MTFLFALRALTVFLVVLAFRRCVFKAVMSIMNLYFLRSDVSLDPLLLVTFSFLFSCGPEYEESKLKLITAVLGTAVNHRRHCN